MEPIEQKAKEYAGLKPDKEIDEEVKFVCEKYDSFLRGADAKNEELKAKIEGMIKEYEADMSSMRLNRVPYIETYAKIEVLQELLNEIK